MEQSTTSRHICTVSRDLLAASQDISIYKFIPGHSYLTHISFDLYLTSPVDLAIINIILAMLTISMMMMMMMMMMHKKG